MVDESQIKESVGKLIDSDLYIHSIATPIEFFMVSIDDEKHTIIGPSNDTMTFHYCPLNSEKYRVRDISFLKNFTQVGISDSEDNSYMYKLYSKNENLPPNIEYISITRREFTLRQKYGDWIPQPW